MQTLGIGFLFFPQTKTKYKGRKEEASA